MRLTEEERTLLNKLIKEQEASDLKRLLSELYNNLSIEDKISAVELGYVLARAGEQPILQQMHLYKIIEFMIEKINTRHCEK